mgnify:CR=1 FL=1
MRFLLVNPADLKKRMFGFLQPQGIGYLATSLLMKGEDVEIIDAAKDAISPERLAQIVKERKVDVVGFYVLSPLISSVREYADEIKKVAPDTVIIVGGPHPTFEPEHTLFALKNVDFACMGDGEEVIPYILKKHPSEIPNLVYRKNGDIVVNTRKSIDINNYPLPAWELIRPDSYPTAPIGFFSERRKIAQIITTRGCPYPCTFCGVPLISGKTMRLRKIEYILSEIELLISKYGIEEIHIIDDNITVAPRNWLKNLLQEIIHANFPVLFALPSGIRVDLLNEEILDLMYRAKFYAFALGIESANQKTLDAMKKKLKVEVIEKKIKLIEKYNFHVQGNFIIGHPSEGVKDTIKTIVFSLKLPIKKAGYFIFNPFPGTEEWENLIKPNYPMSMWEKIIETFNLYRDSKFVKRKIPFPKLFQILSYFLFYSRPKIFLANIKKIRSFTQLKIILRVLWNMIKK